MFFVLFARKNVKIKDCGACVERVSGWRMSGRTSGGGAEGADASALGAGEYRVSGKRSGRGVRRGSLSTWPTSVSEAHTRQTNRELMSTFT